MSNFISKATVENFRCFCDKREFNFTNCHALVGENGTGKTALLEAINLSTSNFASGRIDEQDFNNADKGALVIEVFFEKPFLMALKDGYGDKYIPCSGIYFSAHRRKQASGGKAFSDPFVVEQRGIPIAYEEGSQPDISHLEDSSIVLPASLSITERGYSVPRASGNDFTFTNISLSLRSETIGLPNIFYFAKGREKDTTVGYSTALQKVVNDLNWRYREKWDPANTKIFWNQYYNSVTGAVEDPKGEKIMNPIKEGLVSMLGTNFENIELSLMEIEQPFSKAFFAIREGTNQIEQKRLGSGISILIAYLLVDVMSKRSKEDFIFLIDEPELHLHPQVQRNLFSTFNECAHQVIFSTHSQSFIDISSWISIVRFDTKYSSYPNEDVLNELIDGKKIRDHLDEIKKYYQHRTHFFEEDNQLFFARKCLLVEGPAEKYGLPILAAKQDKKFKDVTIISCNGKTKIPYYQLLCRAYNIPYFTLFDFDGKEVTDPENQRPWSVALEDAKYAFSASFEKVLGVDETEHKANKTLSTIDELSVSAIPDEIKSAVDKIAAWSMERG